MTLGGLALSIGILVDVATVSIENIHVQMTRTKSLARAVERGSHETAVPRLAGARVRSLGVYSRVYHGGTDSVALRAARPRGRFRDGCRRMCYPARIRAGDFRMADQASRAHEDRMREPTRFARFRRHAPHLAATTEQRAKPDSHSGIHLRAAASTESRIETTVESAKRRACSIGSKSSLAAGCKHLVKWRWIVVPAYRRC